MLRPVSRPFFLPLLLCGLTFPLSAVEGIAQTTNPSSNSRDSETIFSGPQPGEDLPAFSFREVLGKHPGTMVDVVTAAKGKPILLVFIHDVNRQSISFTRILTKYASTRAHDQLSTAVVFLTRDPADGEATIKRIQHALTPDVSTGVTLDGIEGPGSYGLNRKVMLTLLIAKDHQVTRNFALIQPSLQTDLPLVLQAIVDLIGGTVPTLRDLEGPSEAMARRDTNSDAPNLRPLLAPLIRREASDEEVNQAARAIETKASEDTTIRREVGRIAKTIVDSGKLENYGTATAQAYLAKWAKQFGE